VVDAGARVDRELRGDLFGAAEEVVLLDQRERDLRRDLAQAIGIELVRDTSTSPGFSRPAGSMP
jgi:hypothetical protein